MRFVLQFTLILLCTGKLKSVTAQYALTAAQACAQYKKQLFETEFSYGGFARDAPVMTTVVDKCKHYDPFIVGGQPANPKEFPPMARIGHYENGRTDWFCGGTLLNERFVLTAAHCFYVQNSAVNRVRLGELDFSHTNNDASPEDFGVKRWIRHPNYTPLSTLYNDIGLIELDRNVNFDSFKHPACLLTSSDIDFHELIAIGWGDTHAAGPPSDHLLKVKLNRFNEMDCRNHATRVGRQLLPSGLNASSQMCAGSNAVRDTCGGDSGGPLLVYHTQYPCMYFVIGVTSAGIEDCGTPNVPGIYTRVEFFLNWIQNYVNFNI